MPSSSVFNLAQARLASAFILALILATTSLTCADDALEGDEKIGHLRSGRQLFNLHLFSDPATVEAKDETGAETVHMSMSSVKRYLRSPVWNLQHMVLR